VARKKQSSGPQYWAHYKKDSGKIYAVAPEKHESQPDSIEITYADYENFINGQKSFGDFIVGYNKTAEGKTVLSLMPLSDQLYGFRSNVFEWIIDHPNKNTECIVTWDGKNSQWTIEISDKVRSTIHPETVKKTVFFVMLENDFDFLIRTIIIDVADFANEEKLVFPFVSNIEKNKDKISISSKIFFQSYGLKIND